MRFRAPSRARRGRSTPVGELEPVALQAVLDNPSERLTPTVGHRDDGRGLFYRGKVSSVAGESEAGKSWLMLVTAVDEIRARHPVLYIDFEDDPSGIVERLKAL